MILALSLKNLYTNKYIFSIFLASKYALVKNCSQVKILEKEHSENQSDGANAFKVVFNRECTKCMN